MRRFLLPALALAAVCLVGVVSPRASSDAVPLGPADDARVLQTVPPRDADVAARAALAAHPGNVALAVATARNDIARARRDSDPRYLGYAQAALRTWWDQPSPPHDVLVMRATIRQSNHEFEAALADLALALREDPHDAQALLTQAILLQLRADFAGARSSCQRLVGLTPELVVASCLANLDGATGHAAEAFETLRTALARSREADPAERAWVETILAELAARAGKPEVAEPLFKKALPDGDGYLFGAYADFLLEEKRPAEVIPLLADKTSADNLFLRLVEAETLTGAREASAHRDELAARYAQSRARGDKIHLREEARFTLHILHDARTALALARENWAIQREPADAHLLVEAARAAGDEAAARPALDSGVVWQ